MKQNIGNIDKAIRIIIALVIAILFFTNIVSGTLAIALLVLAAMLVVTSIVGYCPLYMPCKCSTKKE